jgi:divalent metal cation (Fe/Co/Zn/Cd) transporter
MALEAGVRHQPMDALPGRAYHYGSRFLVEVEVIMPMQFSLKEVHDISLSLQHKV